MVIALAAVTVNNGLRGGIPNRMPAGCNLLDGSARERHRLNAISAVLNEYPLGIGRVHRVEGPRACGILISTRVSP